MTQAKHLVAALLLAACVQSGPFPPDTGAVVGQDLLDSATCGRLGPHGAGAWTPDAEIIAPLEAALIGRLTPELAHDEEVYEVNAPEPGDYYRRYAGVAVGGRRLVAICGEQRSLYDDRGIDWRTNHVPLRDGGSTTFGAYYDPATEEITYFEFGYVA